MGRNALWNRRDLCQWGDTRSSMERGLHMTSAQLVREKRCPPPPVTPQHFWASADSGGIQLADPSVVRFQFFMIEHGLVDAGRQRSSRPTTPRVCSTFLHARVGLSSERRTVHISGDSSFWAIWFVGRMGIEEEKKPRCWNLVTLPHFTT